MSKEVKRWNAAEGGGCELAPPGDSGDYVESDDYDALLAERDAAQKDADRYRWLRDIAGKRIMNELANDSTLDGWDAKIDAALQGEQP